MQRYEKYGRHRAECQHIIVPRGAYSVFSVPVSDTRFAANLLTQMFMRLGRAEKAGSGVDKIVSGWQSLGWPLPTVAEETRPDYVVLTLQLGMKTRQENPTSRI